MVFLKKANTEDAEKEWLFVREMPEDENGLINSYHGVSRDVFLNRALPEMLAFAEGTGLPAGYVPETFFFLWDDDKAPAISVISLRSLSAGRATERKASAWCWRKPGISYRKRSFICV